MRPPPAFIPLFFLLILAIEIGAPGGCGGSGRREATGEEPATILLSGIVGDQQDEGSALALFKTQETFTGSMSCFNQSGNLVGTAEVNTADNSYSMSLPADSTVLGNTLFCQAEGTAGGGGGSATYEAMIVIAADQAPGSTVEQDADSPTTVVVAGYLAAAAQAAGRSFRIGDDFSTAVNLVRPDCAGAIFSSVFQNDDAFSPTATQVSSAEEACEALGMATGRVAQAGLPSGYEGTGALIRGALDGDAAAQAALSEGAGAIGGGDGIPVAQLADGCRAFIDAATDEYCDNTDTDAVSAWEAIHQGGAADVAANIIASGAPSDIEAARAAGAGGFRNYAAAVVNSATSEEGIGLGDFRDRRVGQAAFQVVLNGGATSRDQARVNVGTVVATLPSLDSTGRRDMTEYNGLAAGRAAFNTTLEMIRGGLDPAVTSAVGVALSWASVLGNPANIQSVALNGIVGAGLSQAIIVFVVFVQNNPATPGAPPPTPVAPVDLTVYAQQMAAPPGGDCSRQSCPAGNRCTPQADGSLQCVPVDGTVGLRCFDEGRGVYTPEVCGQTTRCCGRGSGAICTTTAFISAGTACQTVAEGGQVQEAVQGGGTSSTSGGTTLTPPSTGTVGSLCDAARPCSGTNIECKEGICANASTLCGALGANCGTPTTPACCQGGTCDAAGRCTAPTGVSNIAGSGLGAACDGPLGMSSFPACTNDPVTGARRVCCGNTALRACKPAGSCPVNDVCDGAAPATDYCASGVCTASTCMAVTDTGGGSGGGTTTTTGGTTTTTGGSQTVTCEGSATPPVLGTNCDALGKVCCGGTALRSCKTSGQCVANDVCSSSSQCLSGVCTASTCQAVCGGSSDGPCSGTQVCGGTENARQCLPSGSLSISHVCSANIDCATGLCSSARRCTSQNFCKSFTGVTPSGMNTACFASIPGSPSPSVTLATTSGACGAASTTYEGTVAGTLDYNGNATLKVQVDANGLCTGSTGIQIIASGTTHSCTVTSCTASALRATCNKPGNATCELNYQ